MLQKLAHIFVHFLSKVTGQKNWYVFVNPKCDKCETVKTLALRE